MLAEYQSLCIPSRFLADLASPRVVTKIGIFLYDFIQLSIVYAESDAFTWLCANKIDDD